MEQREILTEGLLSPFTYLYQAWKLKRNITKMDLEKNPKLEAAAKKVLFNKRIITAALSQVVLSAAITVVNNKNKKDTDAALSKASDEHYKGHVKANKAYDKGYDEISDKYGSSVSTMSARSDAHSKLKKGFHNATKHVNDKYDKERAEIGADSEARLKRNQFAMIISNILPSFVSLFGANSPETKKALTTIHSSISDIEAQVKKIKDPTKKMEAEKRLAAIKSSVNKLS